MEELRSWFEVPSIAHFCSLFRAAFDLPDFDIEDLEDGLHSFCEDLESPFIIDLICRLLRGCYCRTDIESYNYEVYLKDIFKYRASLGEQTSNPLEMYDFKSLDLREKVMVIYRLCDYRLDAEDVMEQLKGLDGDNMRVAPLGMDDGGATFWYFYGNRLYKEDPEPVIKEEKTKKKKKEKDKIDKKETKSKTPAKATKRKGKKKKEEETPSRSARGRILSKKKKYPSSESSEAEEEDDNEKSEESSEEEQVTPAKQQKSMPKGRQTRSTRKSTPANKTIEETPTSQGTRRSSRRSSAQNTPVTEQKTRKGQGKKNTSVNGNVSDDSDEDWDTPLSKSVTKSSTRGKNTRRSTRQVASLENSEEEMEEEPQLVETRKKGKPRNAVKITPASSVNGDVQDQDMDDVNEDSGIEEELDTGTTRRRVPLSKAQSNKTNIEVEIKEEDGEEMETESSTVKATSSDANPQDTESQEKEQGNSEENVCSTTKNEETQGMETDGKTDDLNVEPDSKGLENKDSNDDNISSQTTEENANNNCEGNQESVAVKEEMDTELNSNSASKNDSNKTDDELNVTDVKSEPEPELVDVKPPVKPLYKNPRWHLVCETLEQWQTLSESLKDSTTKTGKELYKCITNDFLPEIPAILEARERDKRKRQAEMAPRRISARITMKMKEFQIQQKRKEKRSLNWERFLAWSRLSSKQRASGFPRAWKIKRLGWWKKFQKDGIKPKSYLQIKKKGKQESFQRRMELRGFLDSLFPTEGDNNESQSNGDTCLTQGHVDTSAEQDYEEAISEEMNGHDISKPKNKEASSEQMNKEASSEQMNKEASSEQMNKEASSEQMNKEASSEQMNKEASSEQMNKEASSEQMNKEASSDQTDWDTSSKQTNGDSSSEQIGEIRSKITAGETCINEISSQQNYAKTHQIQDEIKSELTGNESCIDENGGETETTNDKYSSKETDNVTSSEETGSVNSSASVTSSDETGSVTSSEETGSVTSSEETGSVTSSTQICNNQIKSELSNEEFTLEPTCKAKILPRWKAQAIPKQKTQIDILIEQNNKIDKPKIFKKSKPTKQDLKKKRKAEFRRFLDTVYSRGQGPSSTQTIAQTSMEHIDGETSSTQVDNDTRLKFSNDETRWKQACNAQVLPQMKACDNTHKQNVEPHAPGIVKKSKPTKQEMERERRSEIRGFLDKLFATGEGSNEEQPNGEISMEHTDDITSIEHNDGETGIEHNVELTSIEFNDGETSSAQIDNEPGIELPYNETSSEGTVSVTSSAHMIDEFEFELIDDINSEQTYGAKSFPQKKGCVKSHKQNVKSREQKSSKKSKLRKKGIKQQKSFKTQHEKGVFSKSLKTEKGIDDEISTEQSNRHGHRLRARTASKKVLSQVKANSEIDKRKKLLVKKLKRKKKQKSIKMKVERTDDNVSLQQNCRHSPRFVRRKGLDKIIPQSKGKSKLQKGKKIQEKMLKNKKKQKSLERQDNIQEQPSDGTSLEKANGEANSTLIKEKLQNKKYLKMLKIEKEKEESLERRVEIRGLLDSLFPTS